MRRFHLAFVAVALPAAALMLFVAGCGKDEKKDNTSTTGGDTTQDTSKPLTVLEPKGGVLKGKITLKGTPDNKYSTLLKDQMATKDTDYCLKGSESETTEQVYRVGTNGALGNVFVWVRPDDGTFFKVDEKQIGELKKQVDIHQPHCAFIPHCLFLFTEYPVDPKKKKDMKPTGQFLMVHNDAEITHNTNWSGQRNKGDNAILSAKATRKVDNLLPETSPVTIKCDIHAWMNAYARVVDTPYYAISKSDTLDGKDKVAKDSAEFGTYEIKNLPLSKVRVLVWHEKSEWLNKDQGKGEVVEITKDTTKDFQAEAK